MTTTIDSNKAWLGKSDPKPMTLLNFLANGHELSDAPGNFLVGIVPTGMSEPVEIMDDTPALVNGGYFYEVRCVRGELRTESSWGIVSPGAEGATPDIETLKYGFSHSGWEVLFLPKRNHPKYQDYLPLSEFGMVALEEVLRSVGEYEEFRVYVGANPASLLRCHIWYDRDAPANNFGDRLDYDGTPTGFTMLAKAMSCRNAFNKLAPLMWFDAETVKRYAPDFYHAPKVEWSEGDYALTMRGRIVMVSEVDGDDVYAVPATTKEPGLAVKYVDGECLSKVDGKLVEELLKEAQAWGLA